MNTLFNMLTRVLVMGISLAIVGYIGTMVSEMAFFSGALEFRSEHAVRGAEIGGAIGGVIGFFKKH